MPESKVHPWPSTPSSIPQSHESLFYSPVVSTTPQQTKSGINLQHYFTQHSAVQYPESIPALSQADFSQLQAHLYVRSGTTPPVSPSEAIPAEEWELEMSQSLSETLATLADDTK